MQGSLAGTAEQKTACDCDSTHPALTSTLYPGGRWDAGRSCAAEPHQPCRPGLVARSHRLPLRGTPSLRKRIYSPVRASPASQAHSLLPPCLQVLTWALNPTSWARGLTASLWLSALSSQLCGLRGAGPGMME